MKIAVSLYHYFSNGGLQQDCMSFLNEVISSGHQCDFYVADCKEIINKNINLIRVPVEGRSNHTRMQRFASKVNQLWEKQTYDAIVGFNKIPGLDYYFVGDTTFLAKALRRWGKFYSLIPRCRQYVRLERAVFEGNKTTCFFITEKEMAVVQGLYHIDEKRMVELPLYVKPYKYESIEKANAIRAKHTKQNDIVLLFVAADFQTKGLDRVLYALNNLPKIYQSRVKLWIVGDDHKESYHSLAKRMGVEPQITYFATIDDIYDMYFAADILIHPARTELAGKVIVEALSAGCAVITMQHCGFSKYVKLSKGGCLLPEPYADAELTKGLIQLIEGNLNQAQESAKAYFSNKQHPNYGKQMLNYIEGRA